MLNLSMLLEDCARRHPDRDALELGDTRLSYAQSIAMPNQVAYLLEYVESLAVNPGQRGSLYNVPIPGTDIIRRGATRTAAANTGFQGAGAQLAGDGLYRVCKAQILGELPGRACAFVHDEIITDCRPEDVEEVRVGQERLMIAAAEAFAPDVIFKAASTAMTHWSKNANAEFDAAGRMIVSQT